jgi:hypothetical protein
MDQGSDTTQRKGASLGLSNAPSNRDGGIRTRDPLNPIQVRYRAALRPVRHQRCRSRTDLYHSHTTHLTPPRYAASA